MLRQGFMPGGTHRLEPGPALDLFSEYPTSVLIQVSAIAFPMACSPDVWWSHPLMAQPMSLPVVRGLGYAWQNEVWKHVKPFRPNQKIGPVTLENRGSQLETITFGIIYMA